MIASLAYQVLRQIMQMLTQLACDGRAKDVELLVLRHQVQRPQLQPSDRLVLAALSRLLSRAQGLLAGTPPVRGQHSVVAAVLRRCRLARRRGPGRRDSRRSQLSLITTVDADHSPDDRRTPNGRSRRPGPTPPRRAPRAPAACQADGGGQGQQVVLRAAARVERLHLEQRRGRAVHAYPAGRRASISFIRQATMSSQIIHARLKT
jgi:hypothetical protein